MFCLNLVNKWYRCVIQSVTQAYLEKENLSSPIGVKPMTKSNQKVIIGLTTVGRTWISFVKIHACHCH